MIQCHAHNVHVGYSAEVVPIRALHLNLSGGMCVAVVASNGAGKTTVLRVLAGLQMPQQGSVEWEYEDGHPFYYLGEADHLLPHLTVAENLQFIARCSAVSEQRVAEIMEFWTVRQWKDRLPHMLSRGQRRRVAFARMAVLNPHSLLLDEPFVALDQFGITMVQQWIRSLRDHGHLVCVAMQDPTQTAGIHTHLLRGERGTWTMEPTS